MKSDIIKSTPVSSANFWEENWSERFLLKVYIVCYFSLIIFSTVELTSFAARCGRYYQLTVDEKSNSDYVTSDFFSPATLPVIFLVPLHVLSTFTLGLTKFIHVSP